MTGNGTETARALLDRFEVAIAARDVEAMAALCADDVVLFGSSRANFGSEATREYLRLVAESNTVRWFLDRWAVVHEDEALLVVAGDGQVESDDGTGPERADFRLTLALVWADGEWRIRHFHGSLPAV